MGAPRVAFEQTRCSGIYPRWHWSSVRGTFLEQRTVPSAIEGWTKEGKVDEQGFCCFFLALRCVTKESFERQRDVEIEDKDTLNNR